MGVTRLVYAPKAYVFTKSQDGTLYNLSPYVTGGQVQRLINQVSSATVTLRNPYRIWTTPSQGVAFHPQDPITIYLERIAGYPVRVFTGYLDNTPYYQLQPGVITLEASCTLKRLLYSYFDPSLPYMIAFFEKYGWINTGQGSIISTSAYTAQQPVTQAQASTGHLPFKSLQDGSFGKLLWATLYDIGEWDDSNIWIEPLPSGANGIVARMEALMKSFQSSQTQASNDFTAFLSAIIGNSGQGSGGGSAGVGASGTGSTGTLTKESQVVPVLVATANNFGIPPLFVVTTWLCETGGNPNDYVTKNSDNAIGYFQFTSSSPYPNVTVNYPQDAEDCGLATAAFCKGALAAATAGRSNTSGTIGPNLNMSDQSQWETWAEVTQDPGAGSYSNRWAVTLQQAQSLINQYGNNPVETSTGATLPTRTPKGGTVTTNEGIGGQAVPTTQSGSTAPASNSGLNVFQAMVEGANALASSGLPYPKPDQHYGALSKTWPAYDCSGSVSYVLYSGGLFNAQNNPEGIASGSEEGALTAIGAKQGVGPGTNAVTIWVDPGTHTFMKIGDRFFGTTDGSTTVNGCGQWLSSGSSSPAMTQAGSGFTPYYIPQSLLQQSASYHGPLPAGSTSIPTTGAGGAAGSGATGTGAAASATSSASAEAFVGQLDFPSIEDQVVAIALGAEHKGLMNDQQLMPFVQQLTQASMRSFMSLPNGDFFAFYPDYFGEMGHRPPYWMIDDLEIMSGGINLTDDALATHVFAVGDNTWPVNNELLNELFSAGTISIFNAFLSEDVINGPKPAATGGLADVMTTKEAVDFIKRYGARPLVQDYPMVRSPIYEMLLAYQMFMTAWANQFNTPFTLTFMPELFPGGKVGFLNHGIQMYINSVTHEWDLSEAGFTTTAEFNSPSLLEGVTSANFPDIPPNMVAAMAEPIKKNNPGITKNQTASDQAIIQKEAGVLGYNPFNSVPSNPTNPTTTNTTSGAGHQGLQ